MHTITADACADVFLKNWVCRFGLPRTLVTDQGRQFEAHLFNKVCEKLDIERRHTTPYHPQANGKVERMHRTLKDALRCLAERFQDWEQALPIALLALRNAIGESGFAPSTIMYGETVSLPHTLCNVNPQSSYDGLPSYVQGLMSNMQIVRDSLCKVITQQEAQNYDVPSYVWLSDPVRSNTMSPRYTGPYKVLSCGFPTIELEKNGRPYKVSVDRVKPAWGVQEQVTTNQPQEELSHTPQNQPYTTRFGRQVRPVDRLVL